MKILGLSDKVVPYIYSEQLKETHPQIELVFGCGDLPASYLEYVLTVLNVPLVWVPGNHDRDDIKVPGAIAADGRLLRVRGLRVLGFGGSRRYKPRGRHQYSEQEMRLRIARHLPHLLWDRLRSGRGFDVLLTHSPPYGIHDADDRAHTGFRAFLTLMRWFRPRLMLHGHKHVVRNLEPTDSEFHATRVVNVYPQRQLTLEPADG